MHEGGGAANFAVNPKTGKMKKTIFTLFIAVLLSTSALAQLEQGTKIVGGEFGVELNTNKSKFENQTVTNSKSTSISLEPRFGYFVIDNLAVGGELSLSTFSSKSESSDNKITGTSFAIGPFVRYYFPPKIFLEGQYAFGVSNTKYDWLDENQKSALSAWSLGAGYAAFLNENIAIEPMIGYQSVAEKDKTEGEPEVKNINSGLFIRVGFQIYLR